MILYVFSHLILTIMWSFSSAFCRMRNWGWSDVPLGFEIGSYTSKFRVLLRPSLLTFRFKRKISLNLLVFSLVGVRGGEEDVRIAIENAWEPETLSVFIQCYAGNSAQEIHCGFLWDGNLAALLLYLVEFERAL